MPPFLHHVVLRAAAALVVASCPVSTPSASPRARRSRLWPAQAPNKGIAPGKDGPPLGATVIQWPLCSRRTISLSGEPSRHTPPRRGGVDGAILVE